MYDDTLNKLCIYYIKYGAFFYACIGYWMLTNRQMFYNETIPKRSKDEPETSNHFVFQKPNNYCFLIVILVVIIIGYMIIYEVFFDFFSLCWKRSMKEEHKQIEGLPHFYKSLNHNNLALWLEEEELIRRRLGYKKLFDQTYEALKSE